MIPRGMSVAIGGMDAQPDGTARHAIRIKDGFGMSIERNSGHAAMKNSGVIDVPRVIGGVSSQMHWELIERMNRLAVQWLEVRHMALIERLSAFGQHDIAIVRSRCCCNT